MGVASNRKYTNGEIEVFWQPDLCVHAGICLAELPKVFNSRRRPWIDLSQADTNRIVKVVEDCPTEALMFRWVEEARNAAEMSPKLMLEEGEIPFKASGSKDSNDQMPEPATCIRIVKNGPIVVKGRHTIELEDGTIVCQEQSSVLCRCNKSKHQPYCDGAHHKL